MRTEAVVMETYGWLSEISLHITGFPRLVVIEYTLEGTRRSLRLENPSPLASLLSVFEECYGFRIFDQNQSEGNQLEFGRYRVEIWDEDGSMAECVADRFEEGAGGKNV